jgi:hypothetical protein
MRGLCGFHALQLPELFVSAAPAARRVARRAGERRTSERDVAAR